LFLDSSFFVNVYCECSGGINYMRKKSVRKGIMRKNSLIKEDHALLAPCPTHKKSESQSAVVVEVVCTRYRRVV
jgi:hypothetical protein